MKANDLRIVFCTCPPDSAVSIARAVLEERLVACVNVVSGVRSLYWWEGKVNDDPESLLVIKTTEDRYDQLEARLAQLHPYEVPEVLAVVPTAGADPYMSWVYDSTRC